MAPTNPSDVFSKMLLIQLIATLIVSVVAFFISGLHACISALLGGGSVLLGASAAALVAKRSVESKNASSVLINLLKAEAIKIILIILLLIIIFKFYKELVPLALIAGLAAAALFSGAALSKFKG